MGIVGLVETPCRSIDRMKPSSMSSVALIACMCLATSAEVDYDTSTLAPPKSTTRTRLSAHSRRLMGAKKPTLLPEAFDCEDPERSLTSVNFPEQTPGIAGKGNPASATNAQLALSGHPGEQQKAFRAGFAACKASGQVTSSEARVGESVVRDSAGLGEGVHHDSSKKGTRKKAAKKTGKKAAKKTGKKAAKKTGKKAAKKAVHHDSNKTETGKKAVHHDSSKKETGKKAAKKTGKKAAKKAEKKAAKKAVHHDSNKTETGKKAVHHDSSKKETGKKAAEQTGKTGKRAAKKAAKQMAKTREEQQLCDPTSKECFTFCQKNCPGFKVKGVGTIYAQYKVDKQKKRTKKKIQFARKERVGGLGIFRAAVGLGTPGTKRWAATIPCTDSTPNGMEGTDNNLLSLSRNHCKNRPAKPDQKQKKDPQHQFNVRALTVSSNKNCALKWGFMRRTHNTQPDYVEEIRLGDTADEEEEKNTKKKERKEKKKEKKEKKKEEKNTKKKERKEKKEKIKEKIKQEKEKIKEKIKQEKIPLVTYHIDELMATLCNLKTGKCAQRKAVINCMKIREVKDSNAKHCTLAESLTYASIA